LAADGEDGLALVRARRADFDVHARDAKRDGAACARLSARERGSGDNRGRGRRGRGWREVEDDETAAPPHTCLERAAYVGHDPRPPPPPRVAPAERARPPRPPPTVRAPAPAPPPLRIPADPPEVLGPPARLRCGARRRCRRC